MAASTTAVGLLGHLRELNSDLVGASTGFMTSLRGRWSAQVEEASRLSHSVVELSALSATEMPGLIAFLESEPDLPFDHVLVHGPAKHLATEADEALRDQVDRLVSLVEGVVVHPETLTTPSALKGVDNRLILENMDARKNDARTVRELTRYFDELPRARFCLDIAHAQQNDPTLRLAHELLDAFGDRLAEVHVSSILRSGHHMPLTADDLLKFEPVLERCTGLPWILEAPLHD